MAKILRVIAQVLFSTLITLLLLEGLFRLAGFPNGANRYVESIVLRTHLSPRKPKGEFRIFTYGESTMHGSQYWPASNPARWLEVYLKDFLPDKNIRVINFARVGQSSDFVYRSLKNTVVYKPDLVIFYSGHNVFLPGNRVDQIRVKEGRPSFQFKLALRHSHFISAVIRFSISLKMERSGHVDEDLVGFEKIETPPSGIGIDNKVVRNSSYYQENVAHFRHNIGKILKLAQQRNIPIILLKPVGNLKDFPPTCSTHRKPLSAEEEKEWNRLFEEGQKAQARGDNAAALAVYEKAYALEPTHADLLFRLGQTAMKQGELQKARDYFEAAKNEDCIIVRAPIDIQNIILEIPKTNKASVIDTEKVFVSEAVAGILGDPLIEDNVHFSAKGHALAGRAIAQEIAEQGWIAPKSQWHFERERSFDEISKQLGINDDLLFSAYLKSVSYFGHKYDSRIFYAQKALQIKPDHPHALRHLAWSYWLKGDRQKALDTYEKLRKLHPADFAAVMESHEEIRKAISQQQPALEPSLQ